VYTSGMSKHGDKLSDQIREAVKTVNKAGMSRYRICKLIGIAESTMSRFMSGGWLGQENMDALADLLGLSIKADKPKKGA
jgi:IS30 family transposase